jgi:hypothetical protein
MSAAYSTIHVIAHTRYSIEQRGVAIDYQRPWSKLSRHEQNNLAREIKLTIEAAEACGFVVRRKKTQKNAANSEESAAEKASDGEETETAGAR